MFCPETGSILIPKKFGDKSYLSCDKSGKIDGKCEICGYVADKSLEIKEKVPEKKKIEVIEKLDYHPKIKVRCENCPKKKDKCTAFYWTQQTRSADEPETRFFKCVDCNHTWREYA